MMISYQELVRTFPSGAHKRNIVQRLLFTPPNENFPATSLKQHANTLLLLDDAVFNVESIL
ncbi:hypothetical protein [Kluyvera sp. M-M157-B]|uniref:hypothetical protein n=1 Tax=Kluyvera sp. M-M157-B TaxID=3402291 RepID=UPI003B436481